MHHGHEGDPEASSLSVLSSGLLLRTGGLSTGHTAIREGCFP